MSNNIKVPLMKNAFVEEQKTKSDLADFILNSGRLSMGEKCFEFENAFAHKQNCEHAILFNSGGSANLAIIQALKNLDLIANGDKIGFSALTWSTNVMPIIQLGLEAVPIDCAPQTLNCMSEAALPQLIANDCKAFFITNTLGFAGDLDKIKEACKANSIILIEDNCESLGTELKSGKTGNFGLASSFSFFVAHHMSTIEGGMVCTNDDKIADMLKIIRANGWDRNLSPDSQKYWRDKYGIKLEFEAKYSFYDLGYNLRPTEITGFLGLNQLLYLEESLKIREKNFLKIHNTIKNNDDFIPVEHAHINLLPAFALPFICQSKELKQKYIDKFNMAGIEVRPMIAGNIERQPFFKKYIHKKYELSGANFLHENSFYCGNCPDYTDEEIQNILNCIKKD